MNATGITVAIFLLAFYVGSAAVIGFIQQGAELEQEQEQMIYRRRVMGGPLDGGYISCAYIPQNGATRTEGPYVYRYDALAQCWACEGHVQQQSVKRKV